MAKKPESVFRERVRKDLKILTRAVVFPIQQKAIRGHPDFIICLNSLFIALELKAEDGELSALQEKMLEDVKYAKGMAMVAKPSNWQKILEVLKEVDSQIIDIEYLEQSH